MSNKNIVSTALSPQAIGPYSQAVSFVDLVFCSGQIALDPVTGDLVDGGIKKQTQQVMQNLKAVIEEAGSDFGKVLKTTIYLTDLNNFQIVNEIYGEYFDIKTAPARATVEVSALPKDAIVEIDLVCFKN